MFNENDLLKIVGPTVFFRGKKIYRQNQVLNINIKESGSESFLITANVKGTYLYSVNCRIGKGFFEDASCSCPYDWSLYCKHVTAVLLYFINWYENYKLSLDPEYKKKMDFDKRMGQYNLFVRNLDNFKNIVSKMNSRQDIEGDSISELRDIYLYFVVGRVKKGDAFIPGLKIFVKTERTKTVIEDIFKFIESVNSGTEYIVKKHDFKINTNKLRKEDREVMEYLISKYEVLSDLFDDIKMSYAGKSILPISMKFFSRLIDILLIHPRVFKGSITSNNKFIINELKDKIVLKFDISGSYTGTRLYCNAFLKSGKMLKPAKNFSIINKEKGYVYIVDQIYKIKNTDLSKFEELLKINHIMVDKTFMPNLIHEIKNQFNKVGNVELSDNIKKITVINSELKIKCLLDYKKEKDIVIANLKFIYDKHEFLPLSNYETNVDKIDTDSKKFLLRDYIKEVEIVKYFTLLGFNFNVDQRLILDVGNNSNNFFEFVYRLIPEMQKRVSFYYSKSFKNIKPENKKSFGFNIKMSKDLDFFDIGFETNDEEIDLDLQDFLRLGKKELPYIRLKNGKFLPIPVEELKVFDSLITEAGIDTKKIVDNNIKIPVYSGLHFINKLEDSESIDSDLDNRTGDFLSNIKKVTYKKRTLPENLNCKLRKYQANGFNWFCMLADYNLGGILSDEMGLGKTVQMITFLLSEKKLHKDFKCLIVCPTSILYNWERELNKFSPDFRVDVLYGNKNEREEKIKALKKKDVFITSYNVLKKDIDLFENITFSHLILDEAQHIKNSETKNAQCAKGVKSKKRFILTGTPIENCVSEIWSLFDFLMPGFLKNRHYFNSFYQKPIMIENNEWKRNLLKDKISPFILRRTKNEVLKDLPPKSESIIYCNLTKEQKQIYMAILEKTRTEVSNIVKEKGFKRSRIEILSALTKLRLLCDHPATLSGNGNKVYTSGKLELLKELLFEAADSSNKIIIFSQFVKMLSIIKTLLDQNGFNYEYLDGSTKNRIERVDNFNNNKNINCFLLSLKAGGVGLNLTSANVVIHYDMWWNPAVEDQATDRAHRIGQKRDIMVYKLITRGTIEEKILELQKRKKNLIGSLITQDPAKLKNITWDDVKDMFGIS